MNTFDVVIVGAGAAGLMCAIEAGKRGRRVLVIDQANKAGKKILMSGGGRCNFTNYSVEAHHYLSTNPHFCKSALRRYTPYDFIELVANHQIPYHEKSHGQLFCDNKSSDIVNMLLYHCASYKVTIRLNHQVAAITKNASQFKLVIAASSSPCTTKLIIASSLVIATGGLSIPSMGSSAFGYQTAEQFGLSIVSTRAGLVPFTLQPHDKERYGILSGIAVPVIVECNQQQFDLDMLFTHRGLSGPAMLQISSYWQPGKTLTLNFDVKNEWLDQLKRKKQNSPKQLLRTALEDLLPKRVVSTVLSANHLDHELQYYTNNHLELLVKTLQQWQIKPNATEGYRTAEVTLGGIDTAHISSQTMEVKSVPGLYFIGEVLDVTGWLGGYNFQWAWSSGWAAGQVV